MPPRQRSCEPPTVPQRLGTMKSFGSLSVNAMRLAYISTVFIDVVIEICLLPSGLRDRYPPSIQILLQSLIQLREPSKLQLGHGLLLAPAGIVHADFVRCGHPVCLSCFAIVVVEDVGFVGADSISPVRTATLQGRKVYIDTTLQLPEQDRGSPIAIRKAVAIVYALASTTTVNRANQPPFSCRSKSCLLTKRN